MEVAQHRVPRTLCHVPFKDIFPLEKRVPFRELVRMAKRR